MYSVPELARIYKTSKQTMYAKIKSEEMKPYVIEGQDGIKIDPSGLNALNLIMANSKVVKGQVDGEHIQNHTNGIDQHLTDYINHLKGQIEDLKKEKQELQVKLEKEKQDLQVRFDQLINMLINNQKQLEAPKGGFFSRVFRK